MLIEFVYFGNWCSFLACKLILCGLLKLIGLLFVKSNLFISNTALPLRDFVKMFNIVNNSYVLNWFNAVYYNSSFITVFIALLLYYSSFITYASCKCKNSCKVM